MNEDLNKNEKLKEIGKFLSFNNTNNFDEYVASTLLKSSNIYITSRYELYVCF
jgi:hypothetical protein